MTTEGLCGLIAGLLVSLVGCGANNAATAPDDLAGLAGTATGDLFVFGDIRDAVRESGHLLRGEPADQFILGLACAGIAVTGPTRSAGMSVAMIETRDLGGTCPNRGCTPKKILVAAGHALHEIERARVHQVALDKPKLDWAALIDRKTASRPFGKAVIRTGPKASVGQGHAGWPQGARHSG